MGRTSITLPDDQLDELDRRRVTDTQDPAYTTRSKWISDAIQARLNAEDAGEWQPPEHPEYALADGGG